MPSEEGCDRITPTQNHISLNGTLYVQQSVVDQLLKTANQSILVEQLP